MLGVKAYTREYMDRCRSKVDSDVAAYQDLVAAARGQQNGTVLDSAIGTFEAAFFNNMVLVLDELFVHRLRTVEGKDGNPLNEVRMLCTSLMENNGVMTADKTIKYDPGSSMLKLQLGDQIMLSEADFVALSSAYFAEIARKYS